MSTPTWASPRDAFPASVHDLMALWGGFAVPTTFSDSGLEKRLELDFAEDMQPSHISVSELVEAMAPTGEVLLRDFSEHGVIVAEMPHSLVLLMARRLVVSSASTVMLHRAVAPLLDLLRAKSVVVEWASFFRRNTTSPWCGKSETSDIMAQEYADLKAAFPTGQSFLTGPVDGDHFFHFIADYIAREDGRTEEDVQVNAFLYDVDSAATAVDKTVQQVKTLPDGEYEMLRMFAGVPCVSFETNAKGSAARLQDLLAEYKPSRFTVVALQDKDTEAVALRRDFGPFASYALSNRTVNHFGEGYAYHQMVFTRQE